MITRAALCAQQVGMFATMPNSQAAFEFAQSLAKAEGMPTTVMTTAIMVYHNSLIEHLKQFTGEQE